MGHAKRILITFLISLFACAAAWAQGTAQINGIVKDQSGAVLPGVEINATQTATGAKRSVVSDETGSYTLTNLPIGPYMLEASLPGFRTYVQTGIVLQSGHKSCGPDRVAGWPGRRAGRSSGGCHAGGSKKHRSRPGDR